MADEVHYSFNLRMCVNIKKRFKVKPLNSTMTVSYTHLDVYKRQVLSN